MYYLHKCLVSVGMGETTTLFLVHLYFYDVWFRVVCSFLCTYRARSFLSNQVFLCTYCL